MNGAYLKATPLWFSFKNEFSYEKGIFCESMPPIPRPKWKADSFTVPGADGIFHQEEKAFENIIYTVDCIVIDDENFNRIRHWLYGGGRSVFSVNKGFYYEGFISNRIDFTKTFFSEKMNPKSFPLVFDLQPFAYNISQVNDKQTLTRSGQTFYGQGTFPALPVITVTGSGTIYLTINGVNLTLTNVSGHITINSKIMECYKDGANANPQMIGEFPTLKANGEINIITYSGSVSKIEIEPFWRWI